MNKYALELTLKRFSLFWLFIIILYIPSIALHEEIHYIISKVSPYDEPIKMEILNMSEYKKNGYAGAVYTEQTSKEIPSWYYTFHELVAYGIQILFLCGISIYLPRKLIK